MEYVQMAFAEDRLGQLRAQAQQERLARQVRSQSPRRTRSLWAALSAWSPTRLRIARTSAPDCTAPSGAACTA